MTLFETLREKIDSKQSVIGVIGLGYVGLPVAASFAEVGFRVIGVDVKRERVETINAGRNPIEGEEPGLADLLAEVISSGRLHATTDYSQLANADVILIDVETPVDEKHQPSFRALISACNDLGSVLRRGALVIIESTVSPGTTEKLVLPILEESSRGRVDTDFFLGACPERVMPGKLLANLHTMSRTCGGHTPATSEAMIALYRHIVFRDLDPADLVTAELVKTAENAYRDVQIAFANEVALICEAIGADVWKVRELVNKSPSREMHLPGAGVGGHCIPKDPWLLVHSVVDNFQARLIPNARAVNDSMPIHLAHLTSQALVAAGVDLTSARVAVLGYAYLENSDDTRNSPTAVTVEKLRSLGVEVAIHDPWVKCFQGDLLIALEECDAALVMVAHEEYQHLDLSLLKNALRTPIMVDGRHVFDRVQAESVGLLYRGVGQG